MCSPTGASLTAVITINDEVPETRPTRTRAGFSFSIALEGPHYADRLCTVNP